MDLRRTVVLVVAVLAGCAPAAARLSGPTSVPAPRGAVYVLGDSLTVGMMPYLARLLPGRSVEIDGKIGRTTTDGAAIVATMRASFPPTVVVALGTNDAESAQQFSALVNQIMALLGARRVVWFNIAKPGDQAFDNDLNLAKSRYRNLEVIDWASIMAAHPQDLLADGIHCTDAGYRLRATVLASVLQGRSQV